jgi:threonine dehydrogenase-like Zn-dependent dehydrogenase
VVAVWSCGPVGQFCIKGALLLGAARVIAIDNVPERLALARVSGAETVNFDEEEDTILEELKEMTGGKGPDKCIDAVGAESHATASFDAVLDKAKAAVLLGTDRPHALRAAIMACRPGGILSVPGVYGGFLDKVPGAAMKKGLTIRTGQTDVNRYALDLLRRIERADRSQLHHYAPRPTGRWPEPLRNLSRQEGRLHQSRPCQARLAGDPGLGPVVVG